MDGCFGFRVQVQAKTLATGQCRVKPSTVATVLGSRYVSAAACGPANLTLTDASDSSEWQVQLAWDGVQHYVVGGLQPWLAHCNAEVGEAIEILREAKDPSRLQVLLVRREVSTAGSGQEGTQQQPASQHGNMPVPECPSEGEAAAERPASQRTPITGGATAPVPALHAACPQTFPPAPAAAAPPTQYVQGAQAGPFVPEARSYDRAAAGHAARGLNTGLATTGVSAPPDPDAGSSVTARVLSGLAQPPLATCAWHPGALLPTHAAVPLPLQPATVVNVLWGHGGGSGGPPQAADLWRAYGRPYGGAPFRPVDLNQRPLTANQKGQVTGVTRVQGSAWAEGTAGAGMAAGSGACGQVAEAGTAVGGYLNVPVGGAGADLRGSLPHAFEPGCARARSLLLEPLVEGMGRPQRVEGGGGAGAEDPSRLHSSGVERGASSGGQPQATPGVAGAPAPGTCSGGAPLEAAKLAAPDSGPGYAGAGVTMRATIRGMQLCLRQHIAAALWPEAATMPVSQPEPRLLHIRPPSITARQTGGGAQQPGGKLRVYAVNLVRYKNLNIRMTGVQAALKALGVCDKEDVGLRRLPCGRVLLERWQQQGQGQEEDTQRAESLDEETLSDEAEDYESDEEYVPSLKRPRLQRLALGDCGTGTGLWARGQQGAQATAMGPQQGTAAEQAPAGVAEAVAGVQMCYKVPYSTYELRPSVAAAHALWPQLIGRLKRSPGAANSIQAIVHTDSGAPTLGPSQPVQQHAVQLRYVGSAGAFRASHVGGVLAALGLRGEGVVQLRRTPDGRMWAECAGTRAVTPAQQQGLAATRSLAAAALATSVDGPTAALQQLAPGGVVASTAPAAVAHAADTAAAVPTPSTTALQQLAAARGVASAAPAAAAPTTDAAGIYDGSRVASPSAYSPCASPAPSPDVLHTALGAPAVPSTTSIPTGPLRVSGGYLHLDRPTVAALWPECVDMPVGTQQLVRMRAVTEPGGGSNSGEAAAAGSDAGVRHSVTHYGSQLARLAGNLWLLGRTQALVRELRLGEGDWVQLVQLEGGVVGVRRVGAVMEAEGQRRGAGTSRL